MNGMWRIERPFWNENNNIQQQRRNNNSRDRNAHRPPSRQWEEKNLTDRRAIDTETAIMKRWERSIALITTATGRGLCDNNVNVEPRPRTLFENYVLWPKCVPSSWGLSTMYQQAKKLDNTGWGRKQLWTGWWTWRPSTDSDIGKR